MRSAGILLPVSSLPSKYGIGAFSGEAKETLRMIARAGQQYWQILPLGPTGYGDSPYQSFSAFAGNPYFIDLDALAAEGLLQREEYAEIDFGADEGRTDYAKLYRERYKVLRKAWARSAYREETAYQAFVRENEDWLADYTLFCALKAAMGGRSWLEWPREIRLREKAALSAWAEKSREEMEFQAFLQYVFDRQWRGIRDFAHGLGLRIIGDIPIYVASDSADAWSRPELFQNDEEHRPVAVAGCPPDAFSADGQLWGNPLYDWDYHEQTGFAWWKKRMAHCLKLYDVVRIDHFRGLDEYYSVKAGEKTAVHGQWRPGPGMKLIRALRELPELKEDSVIAEDLGYMTPSVEQLVRDSGFPGMKVIEFAFDSREGGNYLPHSYERRSVVYTGTHDNQTLRAWYDELTPEDRQYAVDYLGRAPEGDDIPLAFIRLALGSVSDLAVIPLQDYLGLGAEGRMNHPSTMGGNWTWRLKPGQFTEELADGIRALTKLYGRLREV